MGAAKSSGEKKITGRGCILEASSPRKIGDTYYMVYSSVLSHEF